NATTINQSKTNKNRAGKTKAQAFLSSESTKDSEG
ncbi:unnamed protein product, partial [marine sediment metagenome]